MSIVGAIILGALLGLLIGFAVGLVRLRRQRREESDLLSQPERGGRGPL
jgi:uncharacterized integral membrane protein